MNTSSTQSSVPRFLIVENEPGTVSNLKNKLKNAIPGAVIESSATVMDGKEKLGLAYDCKGLYDVVILDFKLPRDGSDPTETADFSLGFLLGKLCPETLVIHMTAWPDDPDFKRLRPAPGIPGAGQRLFFGKDTWDWAENLVAACVRHITEKQARFHSDRVRAEFERLFGGRESAKCGYRASGRAGSGRSDRGRSLEIAVFCDDAGEHWNQLDEPLRQQLTRTLGSTVDEEGNHYLGVVKEDDSAADASKEKSP